MKKKKVLFHSNHSRAFTGFGKNAKNILTYLHQTGKYEVVEACNGTQENEESLKQMPWKTIGTVPSDPEIQKHWQSDPNRARSLGYGGALIDKIIKEEKPDIYIGAEDIWAFNGYWNKKWWNKIHCLIWTTLDSLPILPDAVKAAPQIKHYFVWASFAEKALHKLGHKHVKTLRGSLDTSVFSRLSDQRRKELRLKQGIREDFVIGYVFRNQLRKSVPNLLDGFQLFVKKNPKVKAKLLLHTNWSEGWDIPRLIKEQGLDSSSILTTYLCQRCRSYEVKPFTGQQQDCKFCGGEKSQITPNVGHGVEEEQLNELYNLMDVYCHPFTSGGQEIPIQEAKLAELITLVTNYSCGEDSCTPESGGLPLEWAEYREPGTQFIKASTSKESICSQLEKVYNLEESKKRELEKRGRQFVIDNFSIEKIGLQLEELLDSLPSIEWDFDFSEPPRNPAYIPPGGLDDPAWLIDIYDKVLCMEVDENDPGHQTWIKNIQNGQSREDILKYFHDTASKENLELNKQEGDSLSLLIDDDKDKRLVISLPGTLGDVYMATSLLPSLSEVYPEYAIYFATKPQYFPILHGNPYVHKCIPYEERFDNLLYLEGNGDHPGFFDIAFLPHIGTQKIFNYQHNAQDRIQFDLCT